MPKQIKPKIQPDRLAILVQLRKGDKIVLTKKNISVISKFADRDDIIKLTLESSDDSSDWITIG